MTSRNAKNARKLQKKARSLLESSKELTKTAESENDKSKKLELLVRAEAEAEKAEMISQTAADLAPE